MTPDSEDAGPPDVDRRMTASPARRQILCCRVASCPAVTTTPQAPNGRNGRNGRAERRAVIRRRRIVAGAVAVGLLIVVVAGVVVAVGGGGDDSGGGTAASTAPKNVDSVTLTPGELKVEKPGFPAPFPPDVQTQVMALYTRYVDDGIVTALRTGKAKDADVATLVDGGVTARLAGPDRAVLFDEGLPSAVGTLTVTAPPVVLTALAEGDGHAVTVVAAVQLDVVAGTKQGAVHIVRNGDLLFAPDLTGAWKLTGYDLSVDRSGKGVPGAVTSTSAAGGGTTTTTKAGAK